MHDEFHNLYSSNNARVVRSRVEQGHLYGKRKMHTCFWW